MTLGCLHMIVRNLLKVCISWPFAYVAGAVYLHEAAR